MARTQTKTLEDVKLDMSILYDEVNGGTTELKTAAELANIAGKYLKAEQLQLAREIFAGQLGRKIGVTSEQMLALTNGAS